MVGKSGQLVSGKVSEVGRNTMDAVASGPAEDGLKVMKSATGQPLTPGRYSSHRRPRPKTILRDNGKAITLILADFVVSGKLSAQAVAGLDELAGGGCEVGGAFEALQIGFEIFGMQTDFVRQRQESRSHRLEPLVTS